MTKHVTLSEDHLRILTAVAESEARTIDDIVCRAVDAYLAGREQSSKAIEEAAFGAWGPGEDGLAYQERLRGQWLVRRITSRSRVPTSPPSR